ncbi:insulinase family protein [Candidatus Microgenomates bacterium]|nr:insulinase family protein [Candidatus Microgenomates bacterium]
MKLKFTKTKLPNGLRLITSPMKETDAVSVQVMFGAGSRYETPEISGIAHFLEHMAFKGTKKRPTALDISREIDGVGGHWNASTSEEITIYWIYLPADKLTLALDILSDMLSSSLLLPKEIKKEKGVILEEMKMHRDRPGSFTNDIFQELVYGDTSLGRPVIGNEKTVSAINRQKILDFYRRLYNPNNTVISICGNIKEEKTKKMAVKMFGSLHGQTKEKQKKISISQIIPRVLVHEKKWEQAKMRLGFHSFGYLTEDRRKYTRAVLADILGGYMSSKLFTEIREKRGLAYSVNASVWNYFDTGLFCINGGFAPEKTIKAFRAIMDILRHAKKYGFSKQEIEMAKENNVGSLKLAMESSNFIAGNLGTSELLEGKIQMPDDYLKKIRSVTNQDLKKIAREIFRSENCNLAVVGPLNKEKTQAELLKLIKF